MKLVSVSRLFVLTFSIYCVNCNGSSIPFANQDKIDLVLKDVQVVFDGYYYSPDYLGIQNKYRVVMMLDGTCAEAIFALQKVEKLIDTIGIHNHYAFLVYVYGDNLELFDYYNENEIKYRYPLLYDRGNAFIKNNRKVLNNDINSFLLNPENEILLSGNILNENFFTKVMEHSNEQPDFMDTFPSHQIESMPNR